MADDVPQRLAKAPSHGKRPSRPAGLLQDKIKPPGEELPHRRPEAERLGPAAPEADGQVHHAPRAGDFHGRAQTGDGHLIETVNELPDRDVPPVLHVLRIFSVTDPGSGHAIHRVHQGGLGQEQMDPGIGMKS
jgi:hypothetical protein